MGKEEILKNLYQGSKGKHHTDYSYRRFLIENVRKSGWNSVVCEIASWLHYDNLSDVEEALVDYIADDKMTQQSKKA